MAAAAPTLPGMSGGAVRTGQSVQVLLVGMVDSKIMLDRLLHACRAICGKPEQKLLHRESVYKLTAPAPNLPPPRVSYEMRVRLGKVASSDSEKFVQPMSLICLGDNFAFPSQAEKLLKTDDARRRVSKPSLRKIVEVEVGPTCDEVLKLMGFETDYVFIRSGHMFTVGVENRTSITISELHKLHVQQQTPKIETDAKGSPVDDIWLVEVMTCSETDAQQSVEAAIKEHIAVAEKLQPYVTLNSPDDIKKP